MCLTAPKKTWGGQWLTQGSFFVAAFVAGGQESASKCPTFLSCKTLGLTPKNHTTNSKRAEKRKTECQPFSKTKRGVFPIPLPPKTPHLILPNRPTTTITIQLNPNIGNV